MSLELKRLQRVSGRTCLVRMQVLQTKVLVSRKAKVGKVAKMERGAETDETINLGKCHTAANRWEAWAHPSRNMGDFLVLIMQIWAVTAPIPQTCMLVRIHLRGSFNGVSQIGGL